MRLSRATAHWPSQALLADPLVPTVEAAEAMLDEALMAHAPYLPRFTA